MLSDALTDCVRVSISLCRRSSFCSRRRAARFSLANPLRSCNKCLLSAWSCCISLWKVKSEHESPTASQSLGQDSTGLLWWWGRGLEWDRDEGRAVLIAGTCSKHELPISSPGSPLREGVNPPFSYFLVENTDYDHKSSP